MSTLMKKLLRKQWIITIRPLVSDCTMGYNFSVSCNTRLKSRRKIQSHSIYVSAKIHFDTFYSKQDIAVGIFHVPNKHFLTNQMFFDSHVAGFASTHSKTRHSDVIWCHKHDRHEDGSMFTLMTKLLRKQWIITICPLVSDCTIGYNFSVSCNTRFKSRRTIQSHSIYVSAKFISIPFIVNKISLLVSSTYGTNTFWPVRCFSIILSLLCHQHIRKHATRM